MTKQEIIQLQQALYDAGWFDHIVNKKGQSYRGRKDLAIDGVFGSGTEAALKAARAKGWKWNGHTVNTNKTSYYKSGKTDSAGWEHLPNGMKRKKTSSGEYFEMRDTDDSKITKTVNRDKASADEYNEKVAAAKERASLVSKVPYDYNKAALAAMNTPDDNTRVESPLADRSTWGIHEGGLQIPLRKDYVPQERDAARALNGIDFKKWGVTPEEANRIAALTMSVLNKESSFGTSLRYVAREMEPEVVHEARTGRKSSRGYGSIKDSNFYEPRYLDNRTVGETTRDFNNGDLYFFDGLYENKLAKDLTNLGIDWKNRDINSGTSALITFKMLLDASRNNPELNDAELYRKVFHGKDAPDVINNGVIDYSTGVKMNTLPRSLFQRTLGNVINFTDSVTGYKRAINPDSTPYSYRHVEGKSPDAIDFGNMFKGNILPEFKRAFSELNLKGRHKTDLQRVRVRPNSELTLNLDRGNVEFSATPIGKAMVDGKLLDDCAHWANTQASARGYDAYGNAWTRNSENIYNGYENVPRPENLASREWNSNYGYDAADNLKANFDFSTLDPSELYGVNMYSAMSGLYDRTIKELTNNQYGSHTGNLVNKNGKWVVQHNIHGDVYEQDVNELLGSNGKYGITTIYSIPKKKKMGGTIKLIPKGLFGWISKLYGTVSNYFGNSNEDRRSVPNDEEYEKQFHINDRGNEGNPSKPVRAAIIRGQPAKGCALVRNFLINRLVGPTIFGDAWTGNGKTIYNGYEHAKRPEGDLTVRHKRDGHNYPYYANWSYDAADSAAAHINLAKLDKTKPYYVNMYYKNSPSTEAAVLNGTNNLFGTHTGTLAYNNDKNKWIVTHAIGNPDRGIPEQIYEDNAEDLLGSKYNWGITGLFGVDK